jgi:hypothetical protein
MIRDYLLPIIVCLPIVGSLIDLNKKNKGLISIIAIGLSMLVSIYLAYRYYVDPSYYTSNTLINWIPYLGINIDLFINKEDSLLLSLCLMCVFISCLVPKIDTKKESINYPIIAILTSISAAFILSRNLPSKILLWEVCWIPIFILMIKEKQKSLSVYFSRIWFIAELVLISGLVAIQSSINDNIIFLILTTGTIIRSMSLPFDRSILMINQNCSKLTSLNSTLILQILSVTFSLQVLTTFKVQIELFGPYIFILLTIMSIFKIFELLMKSDVNHIIETQTSIFTLMIMSYIFIIEHRSITDLLIAKSLLNISIAYIGLYIVSKTIDIKKLNFWFFISSIMALFFMFLFYVTKYFINMVELWNLNQQWTQTILYVQPILFFTATTFVLIKTKNKKRDHRGKTTK